MDIIKKNTEQDTITTYGSNGNGCGDSSGDGANSSGSKCNTNNNK